MTVLANIALTASVLMAQPVMQREDVSAGLTTAFTACHEWILKPWLWVDHIPEFPSRANLSGRIRAQAFVPDFALPPPQARRANHHWHVPVGDAGLYVTTDDVQPVCHVVGGGSSDWQPQIEAFLGSPDFSRQYQADEPRNDDVGDRLRTSVYHARETPRLSLVITRAAGSHQRADRPQVLATFIYTTRN